MKLQRLLAVLVILPAVLCAACGSDGPAEEEPTSMPMDMNPVPADLDTSTTRMTEDGLFEVTISSQLEPLAINQIHSWQVHVETADGQPVNNAEIAVDGGMPQHNHGFPTAPEITQFLGNGDYLIEGVRFNMNGWWEMHLDISSDGQQDSITFNIMLE